MTVQVDAATLKQMISDGAELALLDVERDPPEHERLATGGRKGLFYVAKRDHEVIRSEVRWSDRRARPAAPGTSRRPRPPRETRRPRWLM